jgi:hypothetical protein
MMKTTMTNAAHAPVAVSSSPTDGGKISQNPLSLMSAEKLETQNGIKKRRKVCHFFPTSLLREH